MRLRRGKRGGTAPLVMTTPEGAVITCKASLGWTPQAVYDLLTQSAYQLDLIGPHLQINVQNSYPTSIATSAGTGAGGLYTTYNAVIYLDARDGATFPTRPEFAVKAWCQYHLYLMHQHDYTPWLSERGLLGDPRVDSSTIWSKDEMMGDDYRLLFGSLAAQQQAAYVNPNITDPTDVPGLHDWFINEWA